MFAPRKGKTHLWGGEFKVKVKKFDKPYSSPQSQGGLRPGSSELEQIRRRAAGPIWASHGFGLPYYVILESG